MFYIILIAVIILVATHLYLNYSEHGRILNRIPGPKGLPIIGNFHLFFNKEHSELFKVYRNLTKKYGTYKTRSLLFFSAVSLVEPEDIEVLLTSTKEIKKPSIYELFRAWLGDGLLTTTGVKYQQRRKLLTPAFHFTILKDAFKIFNECGKEFVEDLKEANGQEVDVHSYVAKFTLRALCLSAMGVNLNEGSKGKEYIQAVHDMGHCITYRQSNLLFKTNFLINQLPIMKFQKKVVEVLHSFTNKVINGRRTELINTNFETVEDEADTDSENIYNKKKRLAMLDLLLRMERDGKINHNDIQEEVDTFMFAGHDTTASGIKFLLLNLANHKEVQDRLVDELQSIITSPEEEITLELINNLPYLDCCVKESLRLYPPAFFIARIIKNNLQLKNYLIPKGTSCSINIFDLHRNAKYYPDPAKYDPERFTPENAAKRHPFAYIPFSAGIRNCIGQKYGMFELKSVIITLLRNYTILPVTKPEDLVFTLEITLNTINPVKVKFVPRQHIF